jgi:hypothetical protein
MKDDLNNYDQMKELQDLLPAISSILLRVIINNFVPFVK